MKKVFAVGELPLVSTERGPPPDFRIWMTGHRTASKSFRVGPRSVNPSLQHRKTCWHNFTNQQFIPRPMASSHETKGGQKRNVSKCLKTSRSPLKKTPLLCAATKHAQKRIDIMYERGNMKKGDEEVSLLSSTESKHLKLALGRKKT